MVREQRSARRKRRRASGRRLRIERLESRQMLTANGWTNPHLASDVNADSVVSAVDVLHLINLLNAEGAHRLDPDGSGPPYLDTNGDGFVTAMDALQVLNLVNYDESAPVIEVELVDTFGDSNVSPNGLVAGTVTDESGVARLSVKLDGEQQPDLQPDADGRFTYQPPLARDGSDDGPHRLHFRAWDSRGNRTDWVRLRFDLASGLPPAPSQLLLDPASDTGVSDRDGLTRLWSPRVTFAGASGFDLEIEHNGQAAGRVPSAGNGSFVLQDLADGDHTVRARHVSSSGTRSEWSDPLEVTVDSEAPSAPADSRLKSSSDTGRRDDDGVTQVERPEWNLTTAELARLHLFADDDLLLDGPLAGGRHTLQLPELPDGVYAITTRLMDDAGNVSESSQEVSLTIDNRDPARPDTPRLTPTSDTGRRADDGITRDATPTLELNAEAGTLVELAIDGEVVVSQITGGQTQLTLPLQADGRYSLTARATDAAGNRSDWSGSTQLVIDTQPPVLAPDFLGDIVTTYLAFTYNETPDQLDLGPRDFQLRLPTGQRIPAVSLETVDAQRMRAHFGVSLGAGAYELTIAPAADLAGNALDAPAAIPFNLSSDGRVTIVYANWSDDSYSRFQDDPVEEYSYDAVQEMVDDIREEGHEVEAGHPRIFIRESNRDRLRTQIETHFLEWYQEMVDLADARWGEDVLDKGGNSDEPDGQPLVLIHGLIHQLGRVEGAAYEHPIEDYGREGVRHLLNLAAIDGRYAHRTFLGMPLGYDWLYDLMTGEERKLVAERLLEYAQPDHTGIRPYNNPPGIRLMGALAVYGDDNEVDPDRVEETLAWFHNGMVFGDPLAAGLDKGPNRIKYGNITGNMMFVGEGPGIEGLSYSAWYLPFYPLLLAWRDQTGEDYFQLPFFQNWTLHMTHLTGNEYEHFDKLPTNKKKSFAQVNRIFEVALAESNPEMASLAKYHAEFKPDRLQDTMRVVYMLLADPSIEPKSPQDLDLPTTAHFNVMNNVLARNSWQGTDTTWAWFQSPTWEQRKGGPLNDLMIWKNKAMLLGHHINRHDYRGGNRTNTMVLYDEAYPEQTFVPNNVIDSAGNRTKDDSLEALADFDEDAEGYHEGMRFFEEQEGEYVYAFGEGGQVFHGTRGSADDKDFFEFTKDEVELPGWSRQFIWFRNDSNDDIDHFIVLDRVDKGREDLTEHMRFNFADTVEVRDRQTNEALGDGSELEKGIYRYEGADRLVTDNLVGLDGKTPSDARLFVDTLLPAEPVYYRMGGLKERNIDLHGNLRMQSLQMNWDEPESRQNLLHGMWRVQMTDPAASKQSVYLNVLQATDTSVDNPDATTLLEGPGLVGVAVGGNVALFSAAESTIDEGNLTIPAGLAGSHRLLIGDLEPNADYTVRFQDREFTTGASPRGTLLLKGVSLLEGQTLDIRRD